MFFAGLNKNKLNKEMSFIANIVLVILLFCIVSSTTYTFNVSRSVTEIQSLNIDFISNEFMLISKFSFGYSFVMALGFIYITAGVLFAITFAVVSLKQTTRNNDYAKEFCCKAESSRKLHLNNIYLINNQFIC